MKAARRDGRSADTKANNSKSVNRIIVVHDNDEDVEYIGCERHSGTTSGVVSDGSKSDDPSSKGETVASKSVNVQPKSDRFGSAHRQLQEALSSCFAGNVVNGSDSNDEVNASSADFGALRNVSLEDSILDDLIGCRLNAQREDQNQELILSTDFQDGKEPVGENQIQGSIVDDTAEFEKDELQCKEMESPESEEDTKKEVISPVDQRNVPPTSDVPIEEIVTGSVDTHQVNHTTSETQVDKTKKDEIAEKIIDTNSLHIVDTFAETHTSYTKKVLKCGVDPSHGRSTHLPVNDVISEVYKTGERQRVWELLKTKQRVPEQKRVVYPVVVSRNNRPKDVITKDSAIDAEKPAAEEPVTLPPSLPAVTPLMEFQNSLECQLKDLMSTLQDLHAVEKDVIVTTLKKEQQEANKESLNALHKMLQEKVETKKHKSIAVQTTPKFQKSSPKSPSKSHGSSPKKLVVSPLKRSPEKSNNVNNVSNEKGSVVVKKIAPRISVLKTPVRRRKAPAPFSEKCTVEAISQQTQKEQENHQQQQQQNCGATACALLHEILKDTSAASMLKEDPNMKSGDKLSQPASGSDAIGSKTLFDPTEHESGLEKVEMRWQRDQELEHDGVSSSDKPDGRRTTTEVGKTDCTDGGLNVKLKDVSGHVNNSSSISADISIDTVTTNITSSTSTPCPSDNSNDILEKYTIVPKIKPLNYQLEVTRKKKTLDERMHELRRDFINSNNDWLYNKDVTSDASLENAKKVLREAEIKSRILADDNFLKYSDPDDLYSYFETNPHLFDPDLLEVKKKVDENIQSLKKDVEKAVKRKTNGKKQQKRVPLREKNKFI